MRYRLILLIVIVGIGFTFPIEVNAQKSTIPWQVATRDSITNLVTLLGYAIDLVYLDPVDEKFVKNERRQNPEGIELFKSLFRKPGSDTTYSYKNKVIVNFLDTAYIRLYNEFTACDKNDKACKDRILGKLLNLNNRTISVLEYLRLQNLYYNDASLPSDAFPGSSGFVTESVFINNYRLRTSANSYAVDVFTKLTFTGYANFNNQPVLYKLDTLNIRITVEFDQIKVPEGYVFRNYRIGGISDFFDTGGPVAKKHLLFIEPSFSYGVMATGGEFANHELESAFNRGTSDSKEVGFFAERQMNVFQNGNSKLLLATGVLLRNQLVNSSLATGYSENTGMSLTDVPFTPSAFLKKYSLESTFRNVNFRDNQWFLGIPLRLGIDYGLFHSKNLRGYFKTMFAVYFPVESSSSAEGSLNQLGKFTYEHVPGFETVIYMGESDNPFPESYGVSEAYSSDPADLGLGIGNRTDLGLSIKMKNALILNLGPFVSIGSFKVDDPEKDYLAKEGGAIKSPLNALDKLNFLTYGLTMSLSFELTKPIISSQK